MNNLSSNDIQNQIAAVENLAKQLKWESVQDSQKLLAVAESLRDLLALREAGKEPVGYTSRENIHNVTGRNLEMFSKDPDVYHDPIPLYANPNLLWFGVDWSAPQLPAVPEGWVVVPRKLTAENGAKGALSGEFLESKYISCPECFGDDECESCDGSGRIKVDVTVSWDTIKRIYSSSVELFCKEDTAIAAAPKPE